MLSSTNRRILHLISLTLAIMAMVVGLTMKYTGDQPLLESQTALPEVELVNYSDSLQYEIDQLGDPD